MINLIHGDCLDKLKELEDNSVDSIVTDPPYGLSFMGKKWDYDVPSEDIWRECSRVLKPGGHLLAFAGTRTQHRMAVRIEDAGFEIRDMIAWVYGSGFPKSLSIGKAVDKLQGVEVEKGEAFNVVGGTTASNGGSKFRSDHPDYVKYKAQNDFDGWGTALKPALEPITVARKPLIGTVAENVLTHGTGGINIDGCRVKAHDGTTTARKPAEVKDTQTAFGKGYEMGGNGSPLGRFPANLIHDGSEEVLTLFPSSKSTGGKNTPTYDDGDIYGKGLGGGIGAGAGGYGDQGSAARFFYCAKASKKDRNEGLPEGTTSTHPTVKPTDLMRYLCRLVTPPGGTVLDPFMGSGSTGKAALKEGFSFIGIEREAEYVEIAKARIKTYL